MKLATCGIAVLYFALAAGCAEVEKAPPEVAAQAEPPIVAAPRQEEAAVEVLQPLVEVLPSPVETRPQAPAVKAIAPAAKAPAKTAAAPALVEEPRKIEAPVAATNAAITKAPEPTLDLAGLTARLRDTSAVGVFTKLALKNQVDDLLKQFRAYHQGTQKSGIASLRPPYDMLVLKVLAVVQDGDPSLARALSGSREAIWGILADREKFKLIT